MPEKLGNGGHSYEKYDPNTGKYVADGVENKYYDNPSEKTASSSSLYEKYKDFLDTVQEDEELNAIMGWKPKTNEQKEEKYTKPILEMTQEEILTEIEEHKKFFVSKGINLKNFSKAFNNDLKLKCANFREIQRLMEKYPIDLNGCEFISSSKYFLEKSNRVAEVSMANVAYINISERCEWSFSNAFILNPSYFLTHNQVYEFARIRTKKGSWQDVLEEKYITMTSTHEFAHLINGKLIQKEIDLKQEQDFFYDLLDSGYSVMDAHFHMQYRLNKMSLKQMEKIKEECMKKVSDKNKIYGNELIETFNKNSSDYSLTNPFEWFAETFLSLEGGKPTEAALALGEWLKENNIMKG